MHALLRIAMIHEVSVFYLLNYNRCFFCNFIAG